MAKSWYPIINYWVCSGCGICVTKRTNDVLVLKAAYLVVTKPKTCIAGAKAVRHFWWFFVLTLGSHPQQ